MAATRLRTLRVALRAQADGRAGLPLSRGLSYQLGSAPGVFGGSGFDAGWIT